MENDSNRIVLDYSKYLEDTYEYSRQGPYGAVQTIDRKRPDDAARFFSKRGCCPFCNVDAKLVFEHHEHHWRSHRDMEILIKIWECNCGWWECSDEYLEDPDLSEVDSVIWDNLKHAIVRSFDISEHEIPVKTLAAELRKNKQLLFEVDPRKFEHLAQYVFSSFYNCEVRHVGQSHDGGIDLIMILSDDPILVQVKRRGSPTASESVETVREFIGAMYLKNARHGVVLSTAQRFSKEAQNSARQIVEERKFLLFDLIDYGRFCAMLDSIKNNNDKAWEKLIKNYRKNKEAREKLIEYYLKKGEAI